MAATVATVAYLGLEARAVEVQVQLSSGVPKFTIVGLPDKAVAESRERVRAALASIGLALVLKTSMWAKRHYVRLKRWQPRAGHFADRALRRPSARRREAIRKARETGSGD